MEEILGGYIYGSDPELFGPVAHGGRIGGSRQIAGSDEVMRHIRMFFQESGCFLSELFRPGIAFFFDFGEVFGQTGTQLPAETVIFVKFMIAVHQICADKEEFELFLLRHTDHPVSHSGQFGILRIDKTECFGSDIMDPTDHGDHFRCRTGNRREDDDRLAAQTLIAGRVEFRRVFRVDRQRRSARMNTSACRQEAYVPPIPMKKTLSKSFAQISSMIFSIRLRRERTELTLRISSVSS